jgi:flavin reductase (DIM6/NTAB) family NADH-FMN oxidoreductase RutF
MNVEPSMIHRLFYPQVPLIMSCQHRGRVSAMPVVSYASVSGSPPMVAVACNPRGFTCKLTLKAKAFSLSVLDEVYGPAVSKLATTSGAKVKDKLAAADLTHRAGKVLDVPVIEGAEGTLECELSSSSKVGDHVLLMGTVRAAYTSRAFTDSWDFSRYRPILYAGWKDGLTTFSQETGKAS